MAWINVSDAERKKIEAARKRKQQQMNKQDLRNTIRVGKFLGMSVYKMFKSAL